MSEQAQNQTPAANDGGEAAGAPSPVLWKPEDGSKPDWAPDNFWTDDGLDIQKLTQSWKDVRGKVATRQDDLRRQVEAELAEQRAQSLPEKYELQVQLPEDFQLGEIDENNPLMAAAVEIGKEAGLTQEQFNKLSQAYFDTILADLPDPETELAALGGDTERVQGAFDWVARNVPPEYQELVGSVLDRAAGVKMVEWLKEMTGEPAQGQNNSDASGESVSEADLRAMMRDPKYYDPNKRDPSFVRQIEQGFKKLYG